MHPFDPASIQMPCGHFAGGRFVEASGAGTVWTQPLGEHRTACRSTAAKRQLRHDTALKTNHVRGTPVLQ
jgi:hypothetical protein